MENTKDEKLNLKIIANKSLNKLMIPTTILVLLCLFLTFVKGQRSGTNVVGTSVILIIATIFTYIKNKEDILNGYAKYIIVTVYLLVWSEMYLSGEYLVVFAFGFPIYALCILYADRRLVTYVGFYKLLTSVLKCLIDYKAGLVNENLTDYIIIIAVTIMYIYAVDMVTTVLYNFNESNREALEVNIKNNENQDTIIKEVGLLNNTIDNNTGEVLEIINTITEQAALLQGSLNEISNGSQKNTKVIQMQVESAREIYFRLSQTAQVSSEVNMLSNHTDEVIKESNNIINELNNQSKVVEDTNNEAINMMNELQEGCRDITTIISAIENIFSQTTLLALNASIEAARAGESGKGFAVVADEVRTLAEESAKSIEDVIKIASDIEEKVNTSFDTFNKLNDANRKQNSLVMRTTEIFSNIDTNTKNIIEKIYTIDSDVRDIVRFNEEIVENINDISSVAEETMAMTEECTNISVNFQNISKKASELTHELKTMTGDVANIYEK